jgi:hypothetical protein
MVTYDARATNDVCDGYDAVFSRIVSEFKHLGRTLENTDNDWPAVKRAVQQACMTWRQLGKTQQAGPKVMASIYRAVVQSSVCVILPPPVLAIQR